MSAVALTQGPTIMTGLFLIRAPARGTVKD
jgi:hypothetical protein